jgi:hypothetical protein
MTARARWLRLATLAALGAALALAFSGCLVFQSPPTAKQVGKKRQVAVKFTICESGGPNCPDLGNYGAESQGSGGWYPLISFRVPKGTKVPEESFTSRNPPGELDMYSTDSLAGQLNEIAPRTPKQRYLAFAGFPDTEATGEGSARFKVKLSLPKRYHKKFFKVLPTVGWVRGSSGESVDCGDDPFASNAPGGRPTMCIDDPAPDEFKPIKLKLKKKN